MGTIYVSSSFLDLREHRQAVYRTLRQMRHDVVAMEDYVASDQRPVARCLQDVDACDLYVGIFAWRYGYVPADGNPEGLSVTELEYRRAQEKAKPCLIFLLDRAAAWPPGMMDAVTGDGARGERINALRTELEGRHLRATFTTPDELAAKVSVAVQQELVRMQEQRIATGIRHQRAINAREADLRARRVRERFVGHPMLDLSGRFRGRDAERQELGRLLASPSTNLVSVVGRAGIGKTALACHVLRELEEERWPNRAELTVDGIAYLSTRTTGITLERIFLACAQMLGGDAEQELVRRWSQLNVELADKIDRLHLALSGGVYVILLDHLDDLLDEGRIVDDGIRQFVVKSLLARVDARLVVTSRVPLELPPECRPHDHQIFLDAGLSDDDGVALLRDLDAGGTLGLRQAAGDVLVRAVSRLHGIPRALEAVPTLMARRPFDTLDEVLARFYGEDDVVNALVSDAYRTLDEEARIVVDAMAVLGRPAHTWAVEFVVAGFAPGVDVPTILTRLVWARMATADRQAKTAALHPVDRDIVFERLPTEGTYSRPALERRAADYYARLRTPPQTWRTLADVEPHLHEFHHRLAAGDFDDAARVLSEVDIPFLIWRGFTRRAVAMRSELTGRIQDRRLQLRHAAAMGQAFILLGPPEKAIEWMEEAAASARQLGDSEQERQAKGLIGEAYRRLGRIEEAVRTLAEVVAGYDPAVSPPQQSGLLEYSLACTYGGHHHEAVTAASRLLEVGNHLADPDAEARGHDALSLAHLSCGRPAEALDHTRRAIELYTAIGAVEPLAYVHNVQGMALVALGQPQAGVSALRRAERDGEEYDNPRIQGFSLFNLAWATRMAGDPGAAIEGAAASARILTAVGAAEGPAAHALRAGLEAEARGDAGAAAMAYRTVAQLVTRAPDLFPAPAFSAAADDLSPAG